MSWSLSELRVRLVPWNWFKLSNKILYCPFQGGTSFEDILWVVFYLVFVMPLCASVPCGHLLGKGLGKGWPLVSCLWCEFVTFPLVSWVWYLILSIPGLCTLTYFISFFSCSACAVSVILNQALILSRYFPSIDWWDCVKWSQLFFWKWSC